MAGGRISGRMSALSLPIDGHSAVEFKPFTSRTPLLSFASGQTLVTLTLPEHLRAADVEFARKLAVQAGAYAAEVERLYRGVGVGRRSSPGRGRAA